MNPPDFTKFNSLHEELKAELLTFIANKEVDLDTRFDVWLQAPVTLKKHKSFQENFEGLPPDYIGYDAPCHVERYETVTVERILESAYGYYGDEHALTPENLAKFKEDVLAKNIYSFQNDW